MKRVISFGEISRNIIFIIVLIISEPLFIQLGKHFEHPKIKRSLIINSISCFISEFSLGSLVFVVTMVLEPKKRKSFKRKIKTKTIFSIKGTKIKLVSSQHRRCGINSIISITGICLLHLSTVAEDIIIPSFYTNENISEDVYHFIRGLQFYVYSVLSIKVLNHQIYSHHYLAILITTLGLIFFAINSFTGNLKWVPILIRILTQCFEGFLFYIMKWLIEVKFVNGFLIILFQGLFISCIGIGIILWELSYCNFSIINKWYCVDYELIHQFSRNDLYYILVVSMREIIYFYCLIKAISIYSPFHILLSTYVAMIFGWILSLCFQNGDYKTLTVIGYVIIIIGSLIYSEIIILNFWNLNVNTVKMISFRNLDNYQMMNAESILIDWNDDDANIVRNCIELQTINIPIIK